MYLFPKDVWSNIFKYSDLKDLNVFVKVIKIPVIKNILFQLVNQLPLHNLAYLCRHKIPLDLIKLYLLHPQTDFNQSYLIASYELEALSMISYNKAYTDLETLSIVEILVNKNANLNPKNNMPPLFGLIWSNKPLTFNYLLRKGANTELKVGKHQETALSFATKIGNIAMMQRLLRYRPSEKSLHKSFKNLYKNKNQTFEVLKDYCVATKNVIMV